MCLTPKYWRVQSPTDPNKYYRVVVPCGHCYHCMSAKRSEFVYRCVKDVDSYPSCFFVTLKYSNENLHYYLPDPHLRNAAIKKLESHPRNVPFAWSEFVLDKHDKERFIRSLQKEIKKVSPSLNFRYVINGEYGKWSNRPHMHALIFSPIYYTVTDFLRIIKRCWKLGFVDVGAVQVGSINYVAKHTLKEDSGSPLQRKLAPIFRTFSTFGGSVGSSLKKDPNLIQNYYNGNHYIQNGKYTVKIPRFVTRSLHPDRLTDDELQLLQDKTCDGIILRIFQEFGISFSDDYLYKDDYYYEDLKELVSDYREYNKLKDKQLKENYYRSKWNNKIVELRRKHYFDESTIS